MGKRKNAYKIFGPKSLWGRNHLEEKAKIGR
jgi:hypothetical protein